MKVSVKRCNNTTWHWYTDFIVLYSPTAGASVHHSAVVESAESTGSTTPITTSRDNLHYTHEEQGELIDNGVVIEQLIDSQFDFGEGGSDESGDDCEGDEIDDHNENHHDEIIDENHVDENHHDEKHHDENHHDENHYDDHYHNHCSDDDDESEIISHHDENDDNVNINEFDDSVNVDENDDSVNVNENKLTINKNNSSNTDLSINESASDINNESIPDNINNESLSDNINNDSLSITSDDNPDGNSSVIVKQKSLVDDVMDELSDRVLRTSVSSRHEVVSNGSGDGTELYRKRYVKTHYTSNNKDKNQQGEDFHKVEMIY